MKTLVYSIGAVFLATIVVLYVNKETRAAGTDYYVGITNCSDSGPGTSSQPYCTLAKAMTMVAAGGKIRIQPGTYYQGNHNFTKDGNASVLTGTVSCTNGSTTVTGAGTQFLTQVTAGDFIRCDQLPTETTMGDRPGAFFPFTEVASVESNAALTLVEGYRGESDVTGAGDDEVGHLIVIEGLGATPDDVQFIGRKTETALGLTYTKYTGASFDCDEATVGTQDCSDVYYFDLDNFNYTYDDFQAGDLYGTIFQRNIALTSYPFDTEQNDKNYFNGSLDPYFTLNRETIRECGYRDVNAPGTPCSDWATCRSFSVPKISAVPGTLWVDRGATPDRWYFHMRGDQDPRGVHDRIEVSSENDSLNLIGSDYVIVRNLSVHSGSKTARQGIANQSFQLRPTGADAPGWVLLDRIRHYGNQALLSITRNYQHIVLEDSIFRGGIDWQSTWSQSAMINTEISGGGHYNVSCSDSQLGAGGSPTGWADGLILDRMLIHHSIPYYRNSVCDAPEPNDFDWTTDTWLRHTLGTHTLQCAGTAPVDYLWVQNSVIGRGSDPVQLGGHFNNNGVGNVWHLRWLYNSPYPYVGNDGAAGQDGSNGVGGDALKTDYTAHSEYVQVGNIWLANKATFNGNFSHLYMSEADYTSTAFVSDRNAYVNTQNDTTPTVWRAGEDDASGGGGNPEYRVCGAPDYACKEWRDLSSCGTVVGYENLRCKDNNADAIGDFEQHGMVLAYFDYASMSSALFQDLNLGDNALDWTPKSSAPFINAGESVYCPDHDFYGNPRNDGACDIGAVEYQSIPPCTPSWTCVGWSTCTDSIQSRICSDSISCGTDAGRPPQSQACDSTAPATIFDLRGN